MASEDDGLLLHSIWFICKLSCTMQRSPAVYWVLQLRNSCSGAIGLLVCPLQQGWAGCCCTAWSASCLRSGVGCRCVRDVVTGGLTASAALGPCARLAAKCSIYRLHQLFVLQRRLLKVLLHPLRGLCWPSVARKLQRAWLEVQLTSTWSCAFLTQS